MRFKFLWIINKGNLNTIMDTLSHIQQLKNKAVILFLLWLTLSGCQARSSAVPPTSIPFTATPTQMVVALPFVMQDAPEESPTPTVVSISSQTPTPVILPTEATTKQPMPQITLLFTGVIVPARCVQSAIDARGDADYIYDEVRGFISSADLAVGTLNTTLSDLSPHTGCADTYVLVSDSRSAEAASSAGFDVMSVATNHIKNCAGASCGGNYNRGFFSHLD